MAQSKFNTKQIQEDGIVRLENVTSVSITNWSNTTIISFVIDGIKRELPKAENVLPIIPTAEFQISDFGRTFDFECEFFLNVDIEGINKVIIDYFQPNNCQK